ncbi:phenylalanine 4-monooxygenase [Veronia pacifica]|uniref:Phenylalanine-4-hydroxylase n=1 Tax=Veronia pacifica TaxID=1080227 RepID=A0A1C3EKN9_9GAMM|nr:phenylalanine 4-monooxygenase [Veronia pacifica]ODA33801.1 phenylalanine-4-hydroxylase [Veronia pacifica]
MAKTSKYESKPVDGSGHIAWSMQENSVWNRLVTRQLDCINDKACEEYFTGLDLLSLPVDRAPHLSEVNEVLADTTGWQCKAVPALIDFDHFFHLLANKQFPVATFLRTEEDFDYLQEPDFFHEIFGHCAMLTNPAFAEFTHTYGKLGYAANKQQRIYLARLYWFTVEFGLIENLDGLTIYGGGILSSPGETHYAFSHPDVIRKPLNVVDVMRTPYRIDIMQPIYFTIDSLDRLFDFTNMDLMACVEEAKSLGLHAPLFPPKSAQKEQQYG